MKIHHGLQPQKSGTAHPLDPLRRAMENPSYEQRAGYRQAAGELMHRVAAAKGRHDVVETLRAGSLPAGRGQGVSIASGAVELFKRGWGKR
jgi:hypothetical protein